MSEYGRLLTRQIKRYLGDQAEITEQMHGLLLSVSASYRHYENDRAMLERAMDLSSEELQEKSNMLRQDQVEQQQLLKKLNEAIEALAQDDQTLERTWSGDDLLSIADALAHQIKHRKQAEEMLNASESNLLALVENTQDAIFSLDSEMRILSYNTVASRFFNWIYGVMPRNGDHIRDILPGKWYQYWVELFEKTLAGDRFSMEQRAKRDDKEYYFDTSFNPIVNRNGAIIGLTCFSRDITERKQIENKQAQLVQELEAANRELNEFAYIASHDLKSPLHAIGTLTNWIVTDYEDKLDEDGRDKLGMLRTRVQRMSNLLDGMLRYSMINRSKARIEHVVLEELVRSVFKRLTPEATNCTLEVETALPRTRCDKHQMDLVFTNLLGNAIRFMDKPKGHIRVGFRKHPESGAPECYVADNGPGMEARHYDRIFKIFQTLQPKDDFESTGIGLSLVHKIVSGWRGSVYPESIPGEGTTFYFTLPELVRFPQHPSDASVLV